MRFMAHGVGVACLSLALCAGAWLRSACAGAFLPGPGQGQLILSASFSRANQDYDAAGQKRRRAPFRKAEAQAYAEYGLTEWAALIVSPSLLYFRAPQSKPSSYIGLSESEFGARFRLLAFGPAIVSAQATLRTGGETLGTGNRTLLGQGELRGDARLLAGYGFQLFGLNGFVDAQAGYRTSLRRVGAEWRADLTLGLRPAERLLLLAQAFSSFSRREGVRTPARQLHKLQFSAVYDVTAAVALQLGVFTTAGGRNAPLENGVVSAIWLRF